MKYWKYLAVAALMLMCSLSTLTLAALGAVDGTLELPYPGGHDYNNSDNGSIILHKLDIAQFEREKAKSLIASGLLSAGGTVTYTGNIPTGMSLSAGNVVGSYSTSDAPDEEYDVMLGELAALGNIIFRIEQVELTAGKTPGSTDPDDYQLVTDGIDGYAKTNSAGEITWKGLNHSYYRITEEANITGEAVGVSSYILSVPMVDPGDSTKTVNTIHIYPKNRAAGGPVVEKEPPVPDDYNGNILTWTIRSEIPASLKADKGNQKYVITDTMAAGLTYAGNLKVFYKSGGNEVELVKDTDYTTTAVNGATSFTVSLGSSGFTALGNALSAGDIDQDDDGRLILYIMYDTVINISQDELEAAVKPNNEAELEFTNNDGSDYHDETDPVIVEKYAGIRLTKKDGANESLLLPNAKFKVYTKLIDTEVDPASVLKDSKGNELEFITNDSGQFQYIGLGAGTYYIVETAAPANYRQLSSYTEIVISAEDVEGNAVKEATVLNYLDNGFSLPSTGGTGTFMFTAAGIVLILSAGVVFAFSRKKNDKI